MSSAKVETIKLGIFFLILFSAFGSFQIIITYLYQQEGLNAIGPTVLAVTYLTFIFSSIIAASARWKFKTQMVLAAVAYTFNLSTGIYVPLIDVIYVKFIIVSVGAAVCGLSAGFLWVSQAKYIHLLCIQHNISQEKGKYFGMFSTIHGLCNIIAGLIAGFGINLFSTSSYFMVLAGIGLFSILFCILFLTDIQKHEVIEVQVQKYNIKEALKKVFTFYPKMIPIMPMLLIYGCSMTMFTSEITHLLPNSIAKQDRNQYTRFCSISLGIGSAVGGYFTGYFGDKFTAKVSGRFGIGIFLFSIILNLATLQFQELWMTLVASFFWGFICFYTFSWVSLICSRNFQGAAEAFSITRQIQNLTFFLFQIMIIFTKNELNLYILSGSMAVIAIPAVILLNKLPVEKKIDKIDKIEESVADLEKPPQVDE